MAKSLHITRTLEGGYAVVKPSRSPSRSELAKRQARDEAKLRQLCLELGVEMPPDLFGDAEQVDQWLDDLVKEQQELRDRRAARRDAVAPARLRRKATSGHQLMSDGTYREATNLVVDKKPAGYWDVFCAHEKAKYLPCAMCKRPKAQAEANWKLFLGGEFGKMRQ